MFSAHMQKTLKIEICQNYTLNMVSCFIELTIRNASDAYSQGFVISLSEITLQ